MPSAYALAAYALIALALGLCTWLWLRRRRQLQAQKRLGALLPAALLGMVPAVAHAALVAQPGAHNFLTAWDRSWRLPVASNSAVVFRYVCAGERRAGLVVGLQSAASTADTWQRAGSGYAVVLDNGDSAGRSWVAHLPLVNREMTASRVAQNFRLVSGQTYWVGVQHAKVAFGVGDTPGVNTILCTRDPSTTDLSSPVSYVGFGAWDFALAGTSHPHPRAHIDNIRLLGPLPQGTLAESAVNFANYHQTAEV